MTIDELYYVVIELKTIHKGDAEYEKAQLFLKMDATKHNLDEAKEFLENYWKRKEN